MRFFTALFGIVTFAVAALAQIQFTSVPSSVVVGQSYTITWSGGDATQPVTLILREGNPNALTTVGTITTTATGGSFTWTPDSNLPDGSTYTFEIQQGSSINYSQMFTVSGGSASAASTSQASALSSQASAVSSMNSALSSAVSSQSALNNRTTTSTGSSSSSTGSSTSKSLASTTKASNTGSSSSAPTSNGGVSFGANQAVFALGAIAAMLY